MDIYHNKKLVSIKLYELITAFLATPEERDADATVSRLGWSRTGAVVPLYNDMLLQLIWFWIFLL